MSHLSVRTLIEDNVKKSDDSVLFGYARASDFNSMSVGARESKRVHLDSLRSTLEYTEDTTSLISTYQVSMEFFKLDDLGGAEKESAKVLDEMDKLSNLFIANLNGYNDNDELAVMNSNRVEIQSIRKTPLIKVTVDAMTGFLVEFSLICPDDFNYCTIFCP